MSAKQYSAPDALSDGAAKRWEYLKAYGTNSLSFHTFQPGLDYYEIHPHGYIAYKDFGPARFVLCDPVCDKSDMGLMLERLDRSHKRITFFHLTETSANILDGMGYYVNEMGEEAVIDIPEYTFAGRRKMDIRHLHNRGRKDGVEVREIYGDDNIYEQARRISISWLKDLKKTSNELWFITRRPIYSDYFCVRKFYGFIDGQVVAYVYFDPVWDGNELKGYCPSILRNRPEAPKGALAWIIHEALQKFKAEHAGKLYLGLMPFYNLEDDINNRYCHSPYTKKLLEWVYKSKITNSFYGFRSLTFHKQRYSANSSKVYMATKSRFPAFDLLFSALMVGFFKPFNKGL
ncbi:hypothetical protein MNBD_NITROSPINAE04-811 [hydrothermal vent metagenome]|uniref:Phosphatidylglycerol lysyltransferase C-terminal domain-containing protein n=1 Tax=hydrothermal vent metagenome TaxID=652676 RepID=A0A3B1CD88_9ZZZZ